MISISTVTSALLFLSSLRAVSASPALDTRSLSARATSDVTATWEGGNWQIPVTFGNTQTLSLILDTGSEVLWAVSSLNPNHTQLAAGTYYDLSKSQTMSYVTPGETMNITYQDGTGASGPLGSEIITIGGLSITNQHIGVSNWSNPFPGAPGLIGMGRTGVNWGGSIRFNANHSIDFNEPTFFENVRSQLTAPIWTAHLKTSTSVPSTISFGYIDSTKYTGTLASANLLMTTDFYAVNSTSALINGQTVSNSAIKQMNIDTGGTYTYVDPAVAAALYALVPGATSMTGSSGIPKYFVPCSTTVSQLPKFQVSMGDNGGYVTITAAILPFTSRASGTCTANVQARAGSSGTLGASFFGSTYVVFDPTNSTPRIQYAASA